MIDGQCEDAEHQMAEYLGVAAHPHIAPAEIILEAAIDPLGGAALVVAHLLGKRVAGVAPSNTCWCSLPPLRSVACIACGLLAGTALDGVGQVKIAIPVSNALHSPVRFRMAAEEQLAAFLHIEELGFELLAIYHSHPHGPASPSSTDLAEAFYPEALTLIWSGQTENGSALLL